jgi:aspartyl-tRNA(Asn)/glutamyl-tRNA(Gln) amidotransferase subunit C
MRLIVPRALRQRMADPSRPNTDRKRHGWARVASVASALVSDRLTTDDVAHVARLARLDLTPEELDRATAQLTGMLEHFADIDALDLADVEPMNQPYPLVNVFRDDVEGDVLDRDAVLAEAPDADTASGRFRVPPIGSPA